MPAEFEEIPPESRTIRGHTRAFGGVACLLVAGVMLASCGGWSSSETYTGEIQPTVDRPPGAGLGATAEPPPEPVEPPAPADAPVVGPETETEADIETGATADEAL